jgi:uncharacterized membrane protein
LLIRTTGLDPGPIPPVASLVTVLSGFIALARLAKWWEATLVLGVGAFAEIIGLYTGLPFGKYEYTTAWWPVVGLPQGHHFPLLLPFAWFLIAGGCALALRPLGKSALILAPLMATLIDLFMEPVMVHRLGYWRWIERGPLPGGAPWLNAVGWFGTSLLAAIILRRGKALSEDPAWILLGYVVLIAGIWIVG